MIRVSLALRQAGFSGRYRDRGIGDNPGSIMVGTEESERWRTDHAENARCDPVADLVLGGTVAVPEEARTVLKAGAEIPYRAERGMISHYGAVAVSRTGGSDWYAVDGMNSAKGAADVAESVCASKTRGRCEVVALNVPASEAGSFAASLGNQGMTNRCRDLLGEQRVPRKRKGFQMVNACLALHVDAAGREVLKGAKAPGQTLFVAQNALYAAALVYGPVAQTARETALKACRSVHESMMEGLGSAAFSDPERRRKPGLALEARVLWAYARANPSMARCKVIHSERLP